MTVRLLRGYCFFLFLICVRKQRHCVDIFCLDKGLAHMYYSPLISALISFDSIKFQVLSHECGSSSCGLLHCFRFHFSLFSVALFLIFLPISALFTSQKSPILFSAVPDLITRRYIYGGFSTSCCPCFVLGRKKKFC